LANTAFSQKFIFCNVLRAVAFSESHRGGCSVNRVAGALTGGGGKPGEGYPAIAEAMNVRRLTPHECERLQGFPDDFTLITYRGKPAAEGRGIAFLATRWRCR
jgi:DNA (cytosine-5)-methyltransferase 1